MNMRKQTNSCDEKKSQNPIHSSVLGIEMNVFKSLRLSGSSSFTWLSVGRQEKHRQKEQYAQIMISASQGTYYGPVTSYTLPQPVLISNP